MRTYEHKERNNRHWGEQLARRDQALPAPKIIVNPEVKDFYDFTPEDITLDGYEHLGKLSMTVAV